MKENKELIYTGEGEYERVEPFPPLIGEVSPEQKTREVRQEVPTRKGRGWFVGLTVGVALFAAAFLLCDGMHALRASAEVEGEQDWFSRLLTGSFTKGQAESVMPIVTEGLPAEETTGAVDLSGDLMGDGVVESGESDAAVGEPADALTSEQLYAFSAESVPQGMIPIVPMDLSLSGYGESFHYNDTSYTLSLDEMAKSDSAVPVMAGAGEVSVLILHTHATEGYSAQGATYYDPSTTLARAEDPSTGVIAVGDVIADILNQNGIVTLHSAVLHDEASYKNSYSRSAQTIKEYLAKYPSIKLVIDVHRDSVMTSADQLIRPVTLVDGEAVAQVMCVVGSDASGADYSDWRDNLSLAVRLRNTLNGEYGNLCRPVYIKKSTYNQQYAPASLLLEIGASGNSLIEAQRAAELVAGEIVKMMRG